MKHFELKLNHWQDYTYCETKAEALAIFKESMLRYYLPGTTLTDKEFNASVREFDMKIYIRYV